MILCQIFSCVLIFHYIKKLKSGDVTYVTSSDLGRSVISSLNLLAHLLIQSSVQLDFIIVRSFCCLNSKRTFRFFSAKLALTNLLHICTDASRCSAGHSLAFSLLNFRRFFWCISPASSSPSEWQLCSPAHQIVSVYRCEDDAFCHIF